MVFSSMIFLWVFLPILLLTYFLVKDKYKNYVLLIFSLIFYAWGEPKYIVLMLISIILNYIFGILIDKTNNKTRLIVLILCILTNIGLLAYFKYFDFFVENINRIFGNEVLKAKHIVLPIGISFYTFQIMSYCIDLYRRDIKVQKNIFKLALYISFFPQLIAGPIVKYHDIDEQIDKREVTSEKFADGIRRFVYGLSKKVILANTLAIVADTCFDATYSELSTVTAWIGAICYTLQIYYDFSGYSDMAIGLGKMFGFTFMENFNLPYISGSITDFWRRWHISLSTWFKEYIYIPLGGNRKGKNRTYINLWIVFLVTGIWHGASWNFIFWGLFHGFFIFIERLGLKKLLDKCKVINHIYTLFIVIIAWVFFRAPGLKFGIEYLQRMFTINKINIINPYIIYNYKNVIIMITAILFAGIIQLAIKKLDKRKKITNVYKKYVEPVAILGLLTICIMMLVSNTYNPFIYFRF